MEFKFDKQKQFFLSHSTSPLSYCQQTFKPEKLNMEDKHLIFMMKSSYFMCTNSVASHCTGLHREFPEAKSITPQPSLLSVQILKMSLL